MYVYMIGVSCEYNMLGESPYISFEHHDVILYYVGIYKREDKFFDVFIRKYVTYFFPLIINLMQSYTRSTLIIYYYLHYKM